jgi:hypothetical protein
MKSHTLLVALAVTISDSDADSLPAFERAFDGLADYVSVVSVMDREVPTNNYEPQIFADWPGTVKWPHADDLPVDPGFADARGMEHAP